MNCYGTCLICRCTDNHACVHPDEGSCYWVDDTHELCSACLDHKISPVVDVINSELNERRKSKFHDDFIDKGRKVFWRWIGTTELAKRLNTKNVKLLPLLKKMEKLGFLKSKKYPNWIDWAPALFEGCHELGDYFSFVPEETNWA